MTASELLRELEFREISLVVKGNKLRLKGKGAALPADLRQELKVHREELLSALGGSNAGEYFAPPRSMNSTNSSDSSGTVAPAVKNL